MKYLQYPLIVLVFLAGCSLPRLNIQDIRDLPDVPARTLKISTRTGHGSGWAYKYDGTYSYVLTCYHVLGSLVFGTPDTIDNNPVISYYTAYGEILNFGTVQKTWREKDLALIRVRWKLPLIPLASVEEYSRLVAQKIPSIKGSGVIAGGYFLSITPAIGTFGRVIDKNSSLWYAGNRRGLYHSAGTWFGASGGPVVNADGHAVGMNAMILRMQSNYSWATSVLTIREFLKR